MLPIFSEIEFDKKKREPLLAYATYRKEAEDLIARIPKADQRLNDPNWCADKDLATFLRMTSARSGYALSLLTVSYSAGVELGLLRSFFISVLEYFEKYIEFTEAYNDGEEGEVINSSVIAIAGQEYWDANRLICLAILLGWKNLLPRVARVVDYNNDEKDGLVERLLSLGGIPERTMTDQCLLHLPYFKAIKIFNASPISRATLLGEYLDEWYDASRREPYYESHKRGRLFQGYWSWESAAITVLLDVDDDSYRGKNFYPRDIVEFAREADSQYNPAGIEKLGQTKSG